MFKSNRVSPWVAFSFSLFMTFSTAQAVDFGSNAQQQVPGDFNGDGRIDALLQPLLTTGNGAILLQDGTGNLTVEAQNWNPGYLGLDWSAANSVITTADLNGDGRDDVVIQPRVAGNNASVLITDSTAQLLNVTQVIPPGYLGLDWSSAGHFIIPGDFDGDHQKELFLQATTPGGASAIVHADSAGHLVAVTQPVPDGYLGLHWDSQDVTLYVGDFNGDGRQDLLVQVNAGASVGDQPAYALLLADQNGQFTQINESWTDQSFGADWSPATHSLSLQDLHGTGVMDIVLTANITGGTNYVFEPNSQGLLTQPTAKWTGPASAKSVVNPSSTSSTGINVAIQPTNSSKAAATGTQARTEAINGSQVTVTVGYAPFPATATGELSGEGAATGGAASYSLPIVVPPGRMGMQPSVSLSYSSKGGNGVMGMGWSVSGGSAIHRCPATTAQDGYTSGVTYGPNDRLCLDGQHLIAISGTYGQAGAVYHTELDSFVRITQTGNISDSTAEFEVDHPDGHSAWYGANSKGTGTSTAEQMTGSSGSYISSPLQWDIGSERDQYNNIIVYNYEKPSNSEYHLASIVYTGQYSSGTVTQGTRTITFNYATRTDPSISYLAGGQTPLTQVLTSVTTAVSGTTVRNYYLGYAQSPATGRLLLQNVQVCAPDSSNSANCFPATTFNWQAVQPNFGPKPMAEMSGLPQQPGYDYSFIQIGKDYVGTGVRQLYYYVGASNDAYLLQLDPNFNVVSTLDQNASIQWLPPTMKEMPTWPQQQVTTDNDFTNDGAADMLGSIVNGDMAIAISTHSSSLSFSTPVDTEINFPLPNNNGTQYGYTVDTGDYTGNGLNDIVAGFTSSTNINSSFYLYTNQGNGTFNTASPTLLATLTGVQNANGQMFQPYVTAAGDLDGNGLQDFWVYQPAGNGATVLAGALFLSSDVHGNISASYVTLAQMGITVGNNTHYYLMDINGDGLTDIVWIDNNTNHWWYQLNMGGQQFAPAVDTGSTLGLNPDGVYNFSGMFTGDVLNDARDSVFYPLGSIDSKQVQASFCITKVVQGVDTDICDYGLMNGSLGSFDNSVYHYGVINFVENSSGVFVPTAAPDYNLYTGIHSQVGDVNGDGLADVFDSITRYPEDGFYQSNNCAEIYCTAANGPNIEGETSPAPDLMIGATTGFGTQTTWQYKSLAALLVSSDPLTQLTSTSGVKYWASTAGSTGSYYYVDYPCTTAQTSGASEYFCFASSMYVVSDYQTSDGVGGMREYTYGYGDAIYDNKGRGFQGFKTIQVNDIQAGVTTVDSYLQDFPFSGQPTESTEMVTGNNALISDTQYSYPCTNGTKVDKTDCESGSAPYSVLTPYGTFWTYKTSSIETNADPYNNGATVSTVNTSYSYDSNSLSYGHIASTTEVTADTSGDSNTAISTPIYNPNNTTWCINEFSSQTAESKVAYGSVPTGYSGVPAGSADIVRVTGYAPYNAQCQVVETMQDQGTAFEKDTTYAYGGTFGNLRSVTISSPTALPANPYGMLTNTQGYGFVSRVTSDVYNTDGYFLNHTVNAMGQTTTYNSWDNGSGQPTSVSDPNNVTTTFAYDGFGRKIQETDGPMPTVYTNYTAPNAAGVIGQAPTSATAIYAITTTQNGYPGHTTYYDLLDRSIATSKSGFASDTPSVWTVYDNLGRSTQVSEPLNSSAQSTPIWNTTSYDLLNRPTLKTDAEGVQTSYAYTGLATTVTTTPTDSPVRVDIEVHNATGKTLSVENGAGGGATIDGTTHFIYDAAGNPLLIQDANGNQILATYNLENDKIKVVDPDQGTSTFAYDVLGEMLQQTDAKSQQISMYYDLLGRVIAKTQPEGSSIWCYDGTTLTPGILPSPGTCSTTQAAPAIGKLSAVSQYDGYMEAYLYDGYSRPASQTDTINGVAYTTSTTYDSLSRVATVTYPPSYADTPPVANAGPNQQVAPNTLVTLDGTGSSESSGSQLTLAYTWTQTSGPTMTLSNVNAAKPTFTSGAGGDVYVFNLTVSDGLLTASSSVTITVVPLPAAPGTPSFSANPSTSGSYTVSWTGVSVSGQNLTYNLEEATGTSSGPTSGFSVVYTCTVSGSQTCTSTAISHTNNAAYYYWYRVRAQDSSGYGPYSSQSDIHVVVTPSPTATLTPAVKVVQKNTSYTESWGSPAVGPVVTAYTLQQSVNDSSFSSPTTAYSGTLTSWSTSKSTAGDYYYRVQACNTSDTYTTCTAWSNASHITVSGSGQQMIQAPAPASGSSVVQASGASSPLAVTPSSPVASPHSLLAAAPKTRTQRSFEFAPPVYKAWADAKVVPASGSQTLISLQVQYNYNGNGYLQSLSDAVYPTPLYVFWRADSLDEFGQVTQEERFGLNNASTVVTVTNTNDPMGRVKSITSTSSNPNAVTTGVAVVQNDNYTWYSLGNLESRSWQALDPNTHQLMNPSESFTYDLLNRLTSATLSGASQQNGATNYSYDVLGDITYKSDAGTYSYGQAGEYPHAVTAVTGTVNGITNPTYGYDANGNMTSRAGTGVDWNSNNLPSCIDAAGAHCASGGSNYSQFSYAPDKHRYYQTATVNGSQETTVYVGNLEIVTNSTATYNRHRLSAYGHDVLTYALNTLANGTPNQSTSFEFQDNLGSIEVMTQNAGFVSASMGYDSFGQRREPATGQVPQPTSEWTTNRVRTHRGFTNQEMLDNVSLIHMNGRVYDPVLGRFLSVDPVFQFPTNMQSLNPYSYVLNNPLSLTDPTGYFAAIPDVINHYTGMVFDGGWGGGMGYGGQDRDAKGNSMEVEMDELKTWVGNTYGSGASIFGIAGSGGLSGMVIMGGNGIDITQGLAEPASGTNQSASGTTGSPSIASALVNNDGKGNLSLTPLGQLASLAVAFSLPEPSRGTESYRNISSDGVVGPVVTEGCANDHCDVDTTGAIISVHAHEYDVSSDGLVAQEARDWPGRGDQNIVKFRGVINVYRGLSGAVGEIGLKDGAPNLQMLAGGASRRMSSMTNHWNELMSHWVPKDGEKSIGVDDPIVSRLVQEYDALQNNQ